MSAGGGHTCGVRTSGRLYCWGHDDRGQLGDGGSSTDQPAPVRIGTASNCATVSAGKSHTCATKTNGRLYCWGSDIVNQLGNGTGFVDEPAPAQVDGNATNWASVDAGGGHTCARKTNGRLYCWGRDNEGQVGDGGTDVDQPAPVRIGTATDWAAVSAGRVHTCARNTNRQLFCWGDDGTGALGDGPPNTGQDEPVEVAGGATDWATVTASGLHTCARKTTDELYCWGFDAFGQLGDGGNPTNQAEPVQV